MNERDEHVVYGLNRAIRSGAYSEKDQAVDKEMRKAIKIEQRIFLASS